MLILTLSRWEVESANLPRTGLRLVLNSPSRLEHFEAVNESRSNAVLYQLWT
jgi:hypothetical protein